MIEQIKSLNGRMLNATKKIAFQTLADEFELSITYIKQNYIWAGKIPEERQERVLEVFRELLEKQEEKTRKVLE